MEDITIHSDHCPINFQLSTALGSIFHLQCRLRSGKKALEKMRYTEVESSQSIDQQSIDKLHIGVITEEEIMEIAILYRTVSDQTNFSGRKGCRHPSWRDY